jgi:hypothetical protein
MDFTGLLGRMMPDTIALVERVFQQVQEQLARDGAFAASGDTSLKEVVATALGNRLARMIVNDDSAVEAWPTASSPADELGSYDELADRNSLLAAALGACDCWGQHVSCPFCDGLGGPGWALPDERLFASYVYPALNAITHLDGSSTVAAREAASHGTEGRDV